MPASASACLVGPAFGLLATLRVFQWVIDRQRLVNAFLTNVAGPPEPLSLAGARIVAGAADAAFANATVAHGLVQEDMHTPSVSPATRIPRTATPCA